MTKLGLEEDMKMNDVPTDVKEAIKKDVTKHKKAEDEEIRKSKELLEIITQGITESILLLSKDFKIIWGNKTALEKWGYEMDDIIGKHCYQVTHLRESPCELPFDPCPIYELKKTGKPQILTHTHFDKKGNKVFVEISAYPIKNRKGEFVQFVHVCKDITERKQSEEALKESKAKLQAILTGIGDFITIQNKDLDIIWVNQPVRDIWGDVIGKKCYNVYKGLTEKCPDCNIKTVFIEEKTMVAERAVIRPDGSRIDTLVSSSPVRDAEGNIVAVVEIIKDIKERKKVERQLKEYAENLEASAARYRGLYESSIDGIVSVDMDENIKECNQAFASMLRYTKEELYELNFRKLTPPRWLDMAVKIVREQLFLRGYSNEFEIEFIRKDGTRIPVALRFWLIIDKDGKPIGAWSIVRDITERKKLDQMKNKFISIASHEFRTPLTAIKGYIEFILRGKMGEVNPAIKEKLGVIDRNVDRLTRITSDLLDLSQSDEEKLELKYENICIPEVIQASVNTIQYLLLHKQQTLVLKIPGDLPIIRADRDRFERVIINLLSNATKYTQRRGKIEIRVEKSDKLKEIRVSVSDNGIGIAPEHLDKIFNRYMSIATPEIPKGIGLGLSISKEIVERHGGRIWVDSKVNKGSTFIFTLPLQR